jgi:hypothetical protein
MHCELKRAGRPPKLTRAKEQAVVATTLRTPKTATHWIARRLAREVCVPSATVHPILYRTQRTFLRSPEKRIVRSRSRFATRLLSFIQVRLEFLTYALLPTAAPGLSSSTSARHPLATPH